MVDAISAPEYQKEHFETSLSELKITATNEVEIEGKTYPLTSFGQRSLCKLLEIPERFYSQLNADDEELWQYMVSQLGQLKNIDIRFSLGNLPNGKKDIHAFNKSITPWISNESFLEIVDYYIKHTKTPVELTGAFIRDNALTLQTNVIGKEAAIATDLKDIFKLGMNFCNSEIVMFRSYIEHCLNRVVCTNHACIPQKDFVIKMNHTGSSEALIQNFYHGVNRLLGMNLSIERFLNETVNTFKSTNASLAEVESAYSIGVKCAERLPDRMANYDSRIPLNRFVSKYGIEDLKSKSNKWKATATTPMNLYDLYNEITDIASNTIDLTDDEKFSMQVGIGNAFLKEGKVPDLIDVAPNVNWN